MKCKAFPVSPLHRTNDERPRQGCTNMTVPTRSLQKNWINVTMLMRIQLSIRNLYRHKHSHHPTRFTYLLFIVFAESTSVKIILTELLFNSCH